MTAAIFRSTPSLSVPQTQNTAPVLEFACLYTHDLRKKTKRWNDGILRYHTFNKRAMVYDVPRNFIGDMHWTGEVDIQEGDEVTLEKAGVKVEVAERIGETETDLSELRAKKGVGASAEPRKRVERADFGTAAAASSNARAPSGATARGNTQLKHRSLNALLGTPKGPIGKAKLPTKSPFEERYADVENEAWEDGRPAKKARVAETRPTKTTKQDGMPLWARTADRKAEQQQPAGSTVFIDLSDDLAPSNEFLPGFSSDALAPSSPAKAATRDSSARSSSPAFQNRTSIVDPGPMAVRERPRVSRMQELEDDEPRDRAVESARHLAKSRKSPEPERQPSPQLSRPSSVRPGQTLRLATSAPKKRTLLCQEQLTKKPRRVSPEISHTAAEEAADVPGNDDRPKTAKERVQKRLEEINRKKRSKNALEMNLTMASKATPINVDSDDDGTPIPDLTGARPPREMPGSDHQRRRRAGRAPSEEPQANAVPRPRTSPGASHELLEPTHVKDPANRTSHEASAMELARLDRMMLPPAAPRRAPTPPVPIPAPREVQPLRRVISEPPKKPAARPAVINQQKTASKRVPGAPVRYTPTPSPTKRSREPTPAPAGEKEARAPFKNKSKKNLQKSVSLNMTAAGTSTVILGRPFQAPGKPTSAKSKKPEPPPEDVGPWSREAFDLFKWRPPGWNEEKWCAGEVEKAAAPAGLSGGASLPSFLKEKDS